MDFCKFLLERLLETQVLVQREAPPGDETLLIHDAELHEIRKIWRSERGDWADSVPQIVKKVLGRDLDWVIEDAVALTAEDANLLGEICAARGVPAQLVVQLLDVERAAHGLKRRHAVHTKIEELFRQEWRGIDAILAERTANRAAQALLRRRRRGCLRSGRRRRIGLAFAASWRLEMILRSIRLEDFGLFAGVTELDLIPRVKKGLSAPVVLIGGKNGAGKTTLLEAVRLALYGRRALGPRVALSEYEAYLRDRINRNALKLEAAVALEFDYAEAGAVHRYRVRREWAIRGKSVVENLLLDKDGEAISSVPREEWHQFLQELIPPGVSQLFFFDGEKIQQIAGDEDNEQLGEAVRSLLGIELVGRLRTDLGLFLARHQRREAGDVASRLEAMIRELANSSNVIQKLSDDVAELVSTRDSQARASEQIRRRFVSEGGDAALNRNRIESEREDVRRAANRGEHELRELANHLLPFAMAPKLIERFRNALFAASAGGGEKASRYGIALRHRWLEKQGRTGARGALEQGALDGSSPLSAGSDEGGLANGNGAGLYRAWRRNGGIGAAHGSGRCRPTQGARAP